MHDAGGLRRIVTMDGMLHEGLGWPDIVAWIDGAGLHDVPPLFRRGVMLLSQHYADQIDASRELACEAPFDPGKGDR